MDRAHALRRGLDRDAAFFQSPSRRRDGHHDLGVVEQLDVDCASSVYLDGRDFISHAHFARYVSRPLAMDSGAARPLAAYQCDRLYDICRRLRLVGCHLRHDWQNDLA